MQLKNNIRNTVRNANRRAFRNIIRNAVGKEYWKKPLENYCQKTAKVDIGIKKTNAGISIPASVILVRYQNKKMLDCRWSWTFLVVPSYGQQKRKTLFENTIGKFYLNCNVQKMSTKKAVECTIK
jgi:hypothetical protein